MDLKHVNSRLADGCKQVVQVLRVVGVVRNQVAQFVVWERAFPSSGIDEFPNLVKSQAEILFSAASRNGAMLIAATGLPGSAEIKAVRC